MKPNLSNATTKEVKVNEDDLANLIKGINLSEDYLLLKKSFDKRKDKALEEFIDLSNSDWENPLTEYNEDGSVTMLINVYNENYTLIGNLIFLTNSENNHVFFESFQEFNAETGGLFSYYFQTYESKLSVVATIEAGIIKIASVVQEPNDYPQTWWQCTTNCYKLAKDACDGDSECKTLCDGLGGFCTAAIMTSCGIHCL